MVQCNKLHGSHANVPATFWHSPNPLVMLVTSERPKAGDTPEQAKGRANARQQDRPNGSAA